MFYALCFMLYVLCFMTCKQKVLLCPQAFQTNFFKSDMICVLCFILESLATEDLDHDSAALLKMASLNEMLEIDRSPEGGGKKALLL